MIKNTFLVAALASLVSFTACKKDEKKDAEPAAKTTEAAGDKAADKAAAPDKAEDKAEDKAPAAAAGDMSKEEVAEKAIALFTKMNETVKAGAGDCDKIGAELTKVIEGGKDIMEAGKKFDEDPESKKWFDDKYGKQIEATMGEMMGGLASCMDNEAVTKAFEGLK